MSTPLPEVLKPFLHAAQQDRSNNELGHFRLAVTEYIQEIEEFTRLHRALTALAAEAPALVAALVQGKSLGFPEGSIFKLSWERMQQKSSCLHTLLAPQQPVESSSESLDSLSDEDMAELLASSRNGNTTESETKPKRQRKKSVGA